MGKANVIKMSQRKISDFFKKSSSLVNRQHGWHTC